MVIDKTLLVENDIVVEREDTIEIMSHPGASIRVVETNTSAYIINCIDNIEHYCQINNIDLYQDLKYTVCFDNIFSLLDFFLFLELNKSFIQDNRYLITIDDDFSINSIDNTIFDYVHIIAYDLFNKKKMYDNYQLFQFITSLYNRSYIGFFPKTFIDKKRKYNDFRILGFFNNPIDDIRTASSLIINNKINDVEQAGDMMLTILGKQNDSDNLKHISIE